MAIMLCYTIFSSLVKKMKIRESVKDILEQITSDVDLQKTPLRVEKAFDEFFNGYEQSPDDILSVTYESQMDEMIVLKNINFESHCEHHMVPIIGVAHVGYIPNGKIVGASKIARLVDCFAHRLQLQERLTLEIAESLHNTINSLGVAVFIEAFHHCISHRGVKKCAAKFVTKYFTGKLKSDYNLRREFLLSIRD